MEFSKERELKDETINRKINLRHNENHLDNNEIDVKNLKLICYEEEMINEQFSIYDSEHLNINENKKKDLTILSRIVELIYNFFEWTLKIERKINLFLGKLYLKIPGYIFGVIGLIIQIFSTYMALILYFTVDPTYSISHNWISDLGSGPNGSNIVFNMGWILSSGFIFLFNIYVIRSLKNKMKTEIKPYLLIISNMMFTLGIFLVGLFPTTFFVHHYIGAVFYFFGGFFFFSNYGTIALFKKKIPIFHAFMSCILNVCFLLFILSAYYTDQLFELGITITSVEWSIFLIEISLMLLILKLSLVENCYSRVSEKKSFVIRHGYFRKKVFEKKFIEFFNT